MTLADLQERLHRFGTPMLRVWWAPGTKRWCAIIGTGVAVRDLHDQALIEAKAGPGLDIVIYRPACTGYGDTIETAIVQALRVFWVGQGKEL